MRNFFFIFFICSIQVAFSQSKYYTFKSYNIDNGISDNYVEQVFEDSRGFIWLATHNGLNKFDGHSFKCIDLPASNNSGDNSMSRNFVTSLVEDAHHKLWIGTLAGVYLYDPANDKFSIYTHKDNVPNSLSSDYVEELVLDKSGNSWVGTRLGLSSINNKTQQITQFNFNPKDISTIPGSNIAALCVDYQGVVWIGCRDYGLAKVSKDGKKIIRLLNTKGGIPSVSIRNIFSDKDNALWVVTSDKGIFCKKVGETEFSRIALINSKTGKEFVSAFSCISEDNEGNLWIGTSVDGLVVYNKKTKETGFYSENTQYPHVICGNSVDNIYKDKLGNMWISTHGGGISVYCPINSKITYRYKIPFKNALPGNLVSCFCEDHNGKIWIGTDGNGFCKYNPSENTFETYSKSDGLTSNAVLGICEIKNDIFAVATWNGGLNIFDAIHKTFRQYLFESLKSDKNTQDVYGMYYDKAKNWLWCSTYNDGIQIFDCTKNQFLATEQLNQAFPQWNAIKFNSKIVFDHNGNTWVGGGYQFARINKNNVWQYNTSDSTKGCVNSNFCNDILLDRLGNIWVAAFNSLNVYNKKTDCFNQYTVDDINFSESKALLQDSHGNIWISASKGIFKFSTKTNTVKNMTQNWGIPDMQYFRKSAFRTRDGHLYFGGLKGFIVLHEDSNYSFNITPPLCITKLFIRNVEQTSKTEGSPINKDISSYNTLILKYDQSFITLEYAALDYIDNAKIQFKYKLEGFDKEWVYAGVERKANYTNIPPGTYKFLLKSTNSDGNWNNTPYQLTIVILPPWWKTLWAKTLFVIFIFSSIILIILYRERSIKHENKKLENLVASKTKELKLINQTLSEQNVTIQDHYEDLREKQFVIEIKNNQLQEALNVKDKLMTVIAHDFRNPLTTMQGFAKLLGEKIKTKGLTDLQPNIEAITMSANALQSQMTELLEWSVSKDNAANYKPKDIDLTILMGDVLSLVNETVTHKKISIETKYTVSSNSFVDSRMISTVFRNLIINSTKFTPIGGSISVIITDSEDWIEVLVKDTGVGMNQDQIDELLSDKNLLSSDYRSGFGIQICRTFIKRNKGLLYITSQVGIGSEFSVLLPKGKAIQKISRVIDDETSETVKTEMQTHDDNQSILIIDDNKELTTYLKEVFADYFTVYEAFNGREGLKIAQDILPDIILSDINMPMLDGKELCIQLKGNSMTNHIPIILVSGKNLPQDQVDGLLKGADDYVIKPFNVSVLKQKVFSILKNREILANRYGQKKSLVKDFKLPESVDDKLIEEITKKIVENITNAEFDVEKLAKEVSMSRSQLYRKTKAVLGLSPIDYINALKFQKSVEMLKTGKYRISEIAYELGFSDARYFSASFAKRYGVPPSSFISHEKNEADYAVDDPS
jgi:ligand-binding sensor domain-containing protein/signal transduction histidine kinase/DNA-binding response OmpR family regulator